MDTITSTKDFLAVSEGGRMRAHSDPPPSLHQPAPSIPTVAECMPVPEITVEDFTDVEFKDSSSPHGNNGGCQGGLFAAETSGRPRANTCPEDFFRKRNERPPTPPPGNFRKGRKYRSGFSKPIIKESVSFTHHKLSKLTESEDAEDTADLSQIMPDFEERIPKQGASLSATSAGKNALAESTGSFRAQRRVSADCMIYSAERDRLSVLGRAKSATSTSSTEGSSNVNNCSSSPQAEHFLPQSPIQCRFTKMTSGIDNKQLQAC